ncbi:hypothetical protein B0H13DRAFT_1884662 [Mycena leptocephala]|nr:hypothetical protein B0H13DRAFT_1884662 [Mycena leptocephala]
MRTGGAPGTARRRHRDAGLQDIEEKEDIMHNAPEGEECTQLPFTVDPKEGNAKTGDDENGPKIHKEPAGFDGDRVLSNSILFLMKFGWWVELNYAIPEGDIGRVLEMLKIFIFTFAGTSNQNYMGYMTVVSLLQYEPWWSGS